MTATKKHIPGKRIRNIHRRARKEGVINSLRSFARALATMTALNDSETARRWMAGKGMQP